MSPVPKVVDGAERRSALTDVTADIIARQGLGGVSMRTVAAEAGWTTGVLTHYFRDKGDLLRATLESSLEQRRGLGVPVQVGDPVLDALLRTLPLDDDSLRHWKVTVAFCAEATGDPDLATLQRDAYRSHRQHIASLVERTGRAVGEAALVEAERLVALADGIALQALFDPESWPAERQRAALLAAAG